ncbi:hypothetical protein [Candidatus Solirubrobacter pratensis]|uniref:hypothetical protein n=1 Tax=Candidatus Solirubrobacter pratensis TaxID=1298857 RepID=UPI00047FCAC1|nr:hypothetical protein [Candidatus Solirubrobacter pratensis]
MVGTRRALLGAGAGALLAGCGPSEAPAVSRQDVLDEQLRLTRLSVAAGVTRARARARKLEQAGAVAKAASGPSGTRAAYDAEGRALAGYVAAVGRLRDPASRALLAGLIADAAESHASLARRLDRDPLASAFPGQPS